LAKSVGVVTKNRSETQKDVLKTGVATPPMLGKTHSSQAKLKISNALTESWSNLSDEEREYRQQLVKQQWDEKTEAEKQQFLDKGNKAVRQAARHGSKLEREIFKHITRLGYKAHIHEEHTLINSKLHLDIFIPELKTVVEIDGPSHFSNIWGKKALVKTKQSDEQKNGLVALAGYCMIRVKQKKNLSQSFIRKINEELTPVLEGIKNKYPSQGQRFFEIGTNND
jgi:very-short-patch-repair endonuclease